MFCTQCGGNIPDGSTFCTYCGAPVTPGQAPGQTPEPIPGPIPGQAPDIMPVPEAPGASNKGLKVAAITLSIVALPIYLLYEWSIFIVKHTIKTEPKQ